MPLLVSEADRLREAFKLTRGEADILAAVLGSDEEIAPREIVCRTSSRKSFGVLLHRLNKKLPATVHVVPCYPPTGRGRKDAKGGGTVGAIGYRISNDWARDQLMRVARPEQSAERAA